MRILAYWVMPNHWHLVLWPERDGDLARFMTWLTLTHPQRRHARRGSAGSGHLESCSARARPRVFPSPHEPARSPAFNPPDSRAV